MKRLADLIPGLLFAAGLALYTPRLAVAPRYVFDEVYHAYTAGQYVAGNRDAYVWHTKAPRKGVAYMWNHPPLGVHLISVGIRLWGDRPVGWRFMSTVFGAFGLVVAFWLGRALTGSVAVGLLAAGLMMMDGLYFVQARIGMLDVFGVVFMMAALLQFHRFWTAPPDLAVRRLPWVGLLLGLAIATKWNAAYASAMIGVAALARVAWSARASAVPRVPLAAGLGWVALGLGVMPAAVYLLAYVPFFMAGYTAADFVELQRQIFVYHSKLTAKHGYQSFWWQWPIVARPVWYFVERSGETVAHIYALANPIVHWALAPAVVWLSAWWARRRDPALVTLAIGFFGQWLPWALVPRISFAYHFLPAVPFGCVAVAVLLRELGGGPRPVRWVAWGYGILVVAAFFYFYPILAAVPITTAQFVARLWNPGWR